MLEISEIVKKTEDMFDLCNDHFYGGELPRPAITISPDGGRNALGWCTSKEIWVTDTDKYYELNLCAEYLDRPMQECVETMLHEMVHFYNALHEIEDTSNNGYYHNVKYKETAEAHGLHVEKGPKYGFFLTSLTPAAVEWVQATYGEDAFRAARLPEGTGKGKAKSKNRSIKYTCPGCGAIIRATKEVNVYCGDCDEPFERED